MQKLYHRKENEPSYANKKFNEIYIERNREKKNANLNNNGTERICELCVYIQYTFRGCFLTAEKRIRTVIFNTYGFFFFFC